MPSDVHFSFSVLIGGMAVPEYEKDGKTYIESNLYTPVSFEQEVREYVADELEVQKWPVTPYQVSVRSGPLSESSWFYLHVDGVEVDQAVLGNGQSKIFKGFRDCDGIKEFLFALPRFARDRDDRVESQRLSKVGTIEVVRKECTFIKEDWDSPRTHKGFDQANKKDTNAVTGGRYIMSTTKKGRCVEERIPRREMVKYYRVGRELSRLTVYYHMGHTLTEDLNIKLLPMDWSHAK